MIYLIASLNRPKFKRPSKQIQDWPGVSVVIPFRNEKNHLHDLIASLGRQRYDGPLEILLVNDTSTDNSIDIINKTIGECVFPIKIIDSIFENKLHLTSKQQAIDKGVAVSQYELIAFTDADMTFDEYWVETLVKPALSGSHLVYGHTSIATDKKNSPSKSPAGEGRDGGAKSRMFARWQSYQLEFLFAVAFSFFKAGITGSCMGNNLLVKKDSYRQIGGQAGIGYSIVEDRDLYAAFVRNKMKTSIAEPFFTTAVTEPCLTFGQFHNQMRRWARGGMSFQSNLLIIMILFAVQNLALAFALTSLLPTQLSTLVFINFFLTWIFVGLSFKKIAAKEHALLFPLFFFGLIIETVFMAISLMVKREIKWKERSI